MLDSYGRYSTEFVKAISTETYILPSITSVTPTTKYNQISVSVVGANGTNNISKYYYSINDGAYTESTNSSYTFTGLNEKTNYSIKVKVVDTLGKESNEYSLSATTDEYVLPKVTNVSTSSTTSSITINVSASGGTGNVVKYYYSKDNGSNYVESTSSSYTFSNLTSGATFYVKVYVKDSNNRDSSVSATSLATKNRTLVDYVKSLYTGTQGANNIYYHDASLTNGAGDNSYRFAGASDQVNNYVCFGSSGASCPADNLYRIIGVFGDNVKLIKYDYANSNLLGTDGDYSDTYTYSKSEYSTYKGELTTIDKYKWNKSTQKNTWSESNLNKVNLNTNYLNNIGTTWSNLIEDTTWKVSGHTKERVTPKEMYTAEITKATKTYGPENGTSKIGLMYVSDYGFAAAPSAWRMYLYYYENSSVTPVNWMYMGIGESTITPYSSDDYHVFILGSNGGLTTFQAYYQNFVRPVLYLKASVAYAGGSGTKDSPITLEV